MPARSPVAGSRAAPLLPLLLLLLPLLAGSAAAAERLVSPAGSDGGDCSVSPCRSLTYALRNARPGDRVRLAPGTYSAASGEVFPIALPAGVWVEGEKGAGETLLLDDHEDGAPGRDRTLEVTLERSHPTDPTGLQGVTLDGGGLPLNRYGVWIESLLPPAPPGSAPPVLRACRVRGYAAAGVTLFTWGFGAPLLELRARVERCEVRACGTGIAALAFSEDGASQPVERSTLVNNVVLDCGTGIDLRADHDRQVLPQPSGLARVETVLRHNTVLGSTGSALVLASPDGAAAPAVAAEVANNVLAGSGRYGVEEAVGDGSAAWRLADPALLAANAVHGNALGGYLDADRGLVWSSAAELNALPDVPPPGVPNLDLDPQAGPADGRLAASSPCRDAGDPARSAADDVDGQLRPGGAGPDVGADELLFLLRGELVALAPPDPSRAQLFAALAPVAVAGPAPLAAPAPPAPLVVWQLSGGPTLLRLVKDGPGAVRIGY